MMAEQLVAQHPLETVIIAFIVNFGIGFMIVLLNAKRRKVS